MAKEVEYCYNGRAKLLLSSIGGNKSTDVTGRDAQSHRVDWTAWLRIPRWDTPVRD